MFACMLVYVVVGNSGRWKGVGCVSYGIACAVHSALKRGTFNRLNVSAKKFFFVEMYNDENSNLYFIIASHIRTNIACAVIFRISLFIMA